MGSHASGLLGHIQAGLNKHAELSLVIESHGAQPFRDLHESRVWQLSSAVTNYIFGAHIMDYLHTYRHPGCSECGSEGYVRQS